MRRESDAAFTGSVGVTAPVAAVLLTFADARVYVNVVVFGTPVTVYTPSKGAPTPPTMIWLLTARP